MLAEWSDRDLIRQWWYLYRQVLRQPANWQAPCFTEMKEVDAECARRNLIVQGRPMTRIGAEDLADACDDFKRRNRC